MQHAIKAIELAKVFKGKQKTTYLKLIKDKAIEDVEQFLTDELPYISPTPVTVFIYKENETDITEIYFSNLGIQSNEIYVTFDDKDLYDKTPTQALQSLQMVGITNDAFGNTW